MSLTTLTIYISSNWQAQYRSERLHNHCHLLTQISYCLCSKTKWDLMMYTSSRFTRKGKSTVPCLNSKSTTFFQMRVYILNNKVRMFTHCYIEKRVRTCTCILVFTNVAFLASYMTILTNCLLFLNGLVIFRFWCRGKLSIHCFEFLLQLILKALCYVHSIRCLPLL